MPLPLPSPRPGFLPACLMALALALAAASLPALVQAADTGSEPAAAAPAPDPLAAARSRLAASQYPQAVAELRRVSAAGDADWNNLMGYALRKQTPPDLDGAQRHYSAALRLNPRHQGALAYSGELALMKGDLATAERQLASLARLCSSPCEALDELRDAIAKHKAGAR